MIAEANVAVRAIEHPGVGEVECSFCGHYWIAFFPGPVSDADAIPCPCCRRPGGALS